MILCIPRFITSQLVAVINLPLTAIAVCLNNIHFIDGAYFPRCNVLYDCYYKPEYSHVKKQKTETSKSKICELHTRQRKYNQVTCSAYIVTVAML